MNILTLVDEVTGGYVAKLTISKDYIGRFYDVHGRDCLICGFMFVNTFRNLLPAATLIT